MPQSTLADSGRPFRVAVLCGLWPTNMGNAFLQLGAQALVRTAFPSAQVTLTSATPRWLMTFGYEVPAALAWGSRGGPGWKRSARRLLGRFLHRYDDSAADGFAPPDPSYALDLPSIGAYDLIVLPGMLLCEFIIRTVGDSLKAATRGGARLLYLGAGVEKYTRNEADLVGAFLADSQPIGYAARDHRSLDLLARSMPNSYEGIDCGFYVADAFQPPPVTLSDYVVATFDNSPPPPLDLHGRPLVHAHHRCFGPMPREYWGSRRTLISDLPEDYLTVYANATEVHSSRVHACVAALAYDVPARLYSDTNRALLFDAVGAGAVRDCLLTIDADRLRRQKRAQIEWFRATVLGAFPALTEGGILRPCGAEDRSRG